MSQHFAGLRENGAGGSRPGCGYQGGIPGTCSRDRHFAGRDHGGRIAYAIGQPDNVYVGEIVVRPGMQD